ncbi:hypothetical protein AAG570_000481 [Ranatra chinensis]|uniref:Uncharacterized protein n=1 Tax=Ranatra chinensis TaxID=642074 RepID=A0ABD0YX65_9HEMI
MLQVAESGKTYYVLEGSPTSTGGTAPPRSCTRVLLKNQLASVHFRHSNGFVPSAEFLRKTFKFPVLDDPHWGQSIVQDCTGRYRGHIERMCTDLSARGSPCLDFEGRSPRAMKSLKAWWSLFLCLGLRALGLAGGRQSSGQSSGVLLRRGALGLPLAWGILSGPSPPIDTGRTAGERSVQVFGAAPGLAL